MDQQFRNRRGLPVDLCGPYVGDEIEARHARCYLMIDRSEVAVDIPVEVLRKHRLLGQYSEVVLRVSGEQPVSVDVMPILTESQRKTALGWSAEMHDFDRF